MFLLLFQQCKHLVRGIIGTFCCALGNVFSFELLEGQYKISVFGCFSGMILLWNAFREGILLGNFYIRKVYFIMFDGRISFLGM